MDSGRLFFDPSCIGNGYSMFRGPRYLLNMEEPSRNSLFFSSPDEFIDEEYYDKQLPEKKRKLNPEQVHLLEKSFETENKLEPERKTQLAKKLGLQPRQVAVWFQNRRARWKTRQLERDYDLLKSSYDTLLSNYDSIVKETEKLKSEVNFLTEKLQAKEVAGVDQKSDQLVHVDEAGFVVAVQFSTNNKAEDGLSSRSGESGMVDEDGPQLVDSGDSYFPDEEEYRACMDPMDGVQSEVDNGSDNGRSYFLGAFPAVEQQQPHEEEEGEPLVWWVWS